MEKIKKITGLQFLIAFIFAPQPERISGEQYGIHADVWSVGISFMEVRLCLHGVILDLMFVHGDQFGRFLLMILNLVKVVHLFGITQLSDSRQYSCLLCVHAYLHTPLATGLIGCLTDTLCFQITF